MNLKDIEGIGEVFATKLHDQGVKNVDDLLNKAATPRQRKELADACGLTEHKILEWANRADLYRIKGIGSEYSDLLEACGVDTVVELSTRKPENLIKKMADINEAKKLVRQLPTEEQLRGWVDQAKALPRILQY